MAYRGKNPCCRLFSYSHPHCFPPKSYAANEWEMAPVCIRRSQRNVAAGSYRSIPPNARRSVRQQVHLTWLSHSDSPVYETQISVLLPTPSQALSMILM